MTSQNYRVTVAEIDRDHRMIALALLRRLTALSTDQFTRALASGRLGDPLDLCQQIEALLATSRAQYRRLNDARINRRGRSPGAPTDAAAPAALRPFTRNGAYGGCYDDLRALARDVLPADILPPQLERYLDLDALALDLHLDGALWTLDHDGKLHIFRCPRADPHDTHPVQPQLAAAPKADHHRKRRRPRRR